jgi:hypothetical protein
MVETLFSFIVIFFQKKLNTVERRLSKDRLSKTSVIRKEHRQEELQLRAIPPVNLALT